MPELPEVETVVRALRARGLVGRLIRRTIVRWPAMVSPLSPAAFAARLNGRRVESIRRRAKYILLGLSGGEVLLVHLRMTGRLELAAAHTPASIHHHVRLLLDGGRELRFHDTRKFGRWRLTRRPDAVLARLGPEPLDAALTAPALCARLRAHRRILKPLLLDQTFLAGLGNIYADEALWLARLNPCRASDSLRTDEARRLLQAIRDVLRQGIRRGGSTLGPGLPHFESPGGQRGSNQAALQVFRRTGAPCPRCGSPVRRAMIAQRATHYCARCQPPPRSGHVPALPGHRGRVWLDSRTRRRRGRGLTGRRAGRLF